MTDWCGDDPVSPAHGTVGDAGQRWAFVPHASGGMQIKSLLSMSANVQDLAEQCIAADSFSVIVEACESRLLEQKNMKKVLDRK